MVKRTLVMLACFVAVVGCGDDAAKSPTVTVSGDGGPMKRKCIDEDEDGFGRYCDERDCDDSDPDVTDECYRCATPTLDCPCEPGTKGIFCKPPDIKVEGGVLQCSEGTRYCRDGYWSDCEIIGEYVFVPTGG